jgi:hypothetical protein
VQALTASVPPAAAHRRCGWTAASPADRGCARRTAPPPASSPVPAGSFGCLGAGGPRNQEPRDEPAAAQDGLVAHAVSAEDGACLRRLTAPLGQPLARACESASGVASAYSSRGTGAVCGVLLMSPFRAALCSTVSCSSPCSGSSPLDQAAPNEPSYSLGRITPHKYQPQKPRTTGPRPAGARRLRATPGARMRARSCPP